MHESATWLSVDTSVTNAELRKKRPKSAAAIASHWILVALVTMR